MSARLTAAHMDGMTATQARIERPRDLADGEYGIVAESGLPYRAAKYPPRGAVIARGTEQVTVLGLSHFGKQVTVLTGTGEHIDLTRSAWGHWQVLAHPKRPPLTEVTNAHGVTARLWDVQPGMRFVHVDHYSGPSSNFRLDVVYEIGKVTVDHVFFGPEENTTLHQVGRMDFQMSNHTVGAWLIGTSPVTPPWEDA